MTEPKFSEQDLAYVRAEYATLEQLCDGRDLTADRARTLVDEGRLPRATYVLPDGTEMFPCDYLTLLDEAGSVEQVRAQFERRHQIATGALGLPRSAAEGDWSGYLSGEFGACLREVTPEAIVEKGALIAEIDGLVASPLVEDETWRDRLRDAVDRLDEVERPFTDYDRQRWGTVSRDSHITSVRARFLGSDATTG